MAAATTQTEKQVSLKLLVNEETNEVLFAEAKKDFVDILCSILTLPLATIARLVQKESNIGPITVGCLNTLYQSAENFDPESMWTVTWKETLLKPRKSCYCSTLKLNIDDTEPKKYFITPDFGSCKHRYLRTSPGGLCDCGYHHLSRPVFLNDFCKGFVNGFPTYIITDDLIVMANSSYTNLGFLQNFGVKNISSAKEMIVNVTTEKVM
ncbi:uncharacterized protein LOC130749401 [Lotus japonicus]|uniref:uncharacterized protein LOC130749401 n=1 Tax=Lotus japonicus TaxID=34305 RepID=UPI0025849C44|nr:uncharacterized protein LOC130749401 [Lotus japonicus]